MSTKMKFKEIPSLDKNVLNGHFITDIEIISINDLLNTLTDKQLHKLIQRVFEHIRIKNGSD